MVSTDELESTDLSCNAITRNVKYHVFKVKLQPNNDLKDYHNQLLTTFDRTAILTSNEKLYDCFSSVAKPPSTMQ